MLTSGVREGMRFSERDWTVEFCCLSVCKVRMSRNNCFFIAVNVSLVFAKVSACEHIVASSGFLW